MPRLHDVLRTLGTTSLSPLTLTGDPLSPPAPPEYDLDDLPTLGWLQVTDVGEENMYFTLEDGTDGFCKVLA